LGEESVRALGALHGLGSRKKLPAENRREMHFSSNEEKEKWIDNDEDRETTDARKRVRDTETAIMQEQEHMRNVEKAQSTTTQPETTFEEMLNAVGERLSKYASYQDEEDGEDEDDDEEDTELANLSEDDEPGWVMGTISKTAQHRMESFQQKQMRLDELTQPRWGDSAAYIRERDMKYGTTGLKVLAVGKPQTDTTAATASPTTFGELLQLLDIVHRHSQMPQVTSRQGGSQLRLGSEEPPADNHIVYLIPDTVPSLSQGEIVTPIQPMSIYPSE